jgi:hypothetical protein
MAVGLLLIWRGLPYAGLRSTPDIVSLSGAQTWIALACGVVLGVGKGMTALRKGARRAATQIVARGEDAPAWTVFSPFMILLVGLMVGLGLTLRLAPYDATIKAWVIGILYPGIGVALLIGGWLARTAAPLPPRN